MPFLNSFETVAVARNVEDAAAARSTPMVPAALADQLSKEKFTSKAGVSAAGGMVRKDNYLQIFVNPNTLIHFQSLIALCS